MGGTKDLGAFSAVNNHKIHLEQPCKVATEIRWLELASVCSEKIKRRSVTNTDSYLGDTESGVVETLASGRRIWKRQWNTTVKDDASYTRGLRKCTIGNRSH